MDFIRKSVIPPQLQNCTESDNSSEELPPRNIRLRGTNSVLAKLNQGSTSDIGSCGNYSIETPLSSISETESTKNVNTGLWLKRPLQTARPVVFEKRMKLAKNENGKTHITGQDTMENLDNISVVLQQSTSGNTNNQLDKSEFDAFANFLNKGSNFHSAKSKSDEAPFEADDDLFSQSFNTQMINQIDVAIAHEKTKSFSEGEDEETDILHKENLCPNAPFKMPVPPTGVKSYKDKCLDKSLLFSDDTVTGLYKKEVDELFEQIEKSICEMGTGNENKTISDSMLEVFFADDLIKSSNMEIDDEKIQEELSKSLAERHAHDESFFSEANCSFGTIIRQALLNNANKAFQPPKQTSTNLDSTLNRSAADVVQFNKLGDFYGLPDNAKNLIKHYKGIEKLYDWQHECLNLAITNRNNLIYVLPTSGGKTLVAEILMVREVLCYQRNALFILPYVAIVQEKVWDFSPFGVALDFLVEEYASSKGTYPPRKRRRKRSVYIATIEKALGLINSLIETGRLNELGLIVVDELHLIGEPGRGATLEACLTKIMFLNGNIQIVGMSATIGNIEDISTFLNAELYTKDFRPVELTEYVKCENQIAKINWSSKDESDLFVDAKTLDFKYSEAVARLDPDMLGGLVLQVVPKGSCLVFCPSKRNCENVVHLLCKLTKPYLKEHKKLEKEQLLLALTSEAGELCPTLQVSVPFGIAYHHSGLTNEERRLLENAFRQGTISVICCTSTLAAGVNLPARRVVLRSPYVGREFINLAKYKQMAGRAGRTGLGESGESIIVTSKGDLPKVKQLLMSPMNQALSGLHSFDCRGLRHLLLSCISLGIANTRAELHRVVRATLMAVQVDKLDVNLKELTDGVIKKLFKLGALQENNAKSTEGSTESQSNMTVKMDTSTATFMEPDLDSSMNDDGTGSSKKSKKTLMLTNSTKLVVSNLGSAAIKGGLDLTRAHQLYDDLYHAQKSLVLLNCLHLLYLVTPYDTAEQIKPNIHVYYDVLTHLNEKEGHTARILGFDEAVTVRMATGQIAKQIPEKVLNRFYVTLMLYDLWNGTPMFKVSEKYQINRGIVQNLMTASATFASNVVNFCEQLEEFWAFSHLLKGMSQRLSHCCMRELLPLMELPAVKQTRAKQLFNAGYKNLQSIAKANVDDLVENIEFMSRRTAGQLIAASKMLLLEKVENLREDAEDVLDGVENPRQLLNASVIPSK